MTFENLTADADELRRKLGHQRWAVLGHSFGGHVPLEYALRYQAGGITRRRVSGGGFLSCRAGR